MRADPLPKEHLKGIDIRRTGLFPRYPDGYRCSPLTSLYASWDDVDGTRRDERHSGVDGGRLGDAILAPADGVVLAAWQANWGWGQEGSVLIRHTKEDLGLGEGPAFYYSEFDHLRMEEVRRLTEGEKVSRGQRIATVFRPGGKAQYLPEVHWEVWQVDDDSSLRWSTNRYGGRYWTNKTAHLIDPLYLLSLNGTIGEDGSVDIPVYDPQIDYSQFRGFSYILPCTPK